MTARTATASRTSTPRTDRHPRIAGWRVTDLSALAGGAVWLSLVGAERVAAIDLSVVELYVTLATLVLVPLGLGLVANAIPRRTATDPRYRWIVLGQFPAALATVAALASPQGSLWAVALAAPWLGVTGSIALLGVRARLGREAVSPEPDPALAIDAALLYVPVAAVFLLLHAAGISLRFDPIVVLLTVVHFHYAGFVLPLVVGVAGLRLTGGSGFATTPIGRVWAATTAVIVVGILAVAVGIAFSPAVEVLAVAVFTTGVVGFAVLSLREVVPEVPRLPGALLIVASLSICWAMALALAFAYSVFPGTSVLVTIPEMIRWHGSVNAFGFALPALLTFRLLDDSATPSPRG